MSLDMPEHCARKVTLTSDELDEFKKAEEVKISEFIKAKEHVYENRRKCVKDEEVLQDIEKYLTFCTCDHTIWNYRVEVLEEAHTKGDELSVDEYFKQELKFVKSILKINPKSYSTVNYWRWILRTASNVNWESEIKLIEKLLDIDERNFHCWDARRYIVEVSKKYDGMHEINYAKSMIEKNFSNYSAWHYRATKIESTFSNDYSKRSALFKDDLDMVWNAIYVDPSDQCAWLYHRHILSYLEEYDKNTQFTLICEFLDIEPRCKYALLAFVHLAPVDIPCSKELSILKEIDPKRKNYYSYLSSKRSNNA